MPRTFLPLLCALRVLFRRLETSAHSVGRGALLDRAIKVRRRSGVALLDPLLLGATHDTLRAVVALGKAAVVGQG